MRLKKLLLVSTCALAIGAGTTLGNNALLPTSQTVYAQHFLPTILTGKTIRGTINILIKASIQFSWIIAIKEEIKTAKLDSAWVKVPVSML